MRKGTKMPTWTFKTLEALRLADDFMSAEQLRDATGAAGNQMSAALHHLKERHAIDAIEANGKLWWYITGQDDRTKTVDERVPEEPGTRKRRPRAPKA